MRAFIGLCMTLLACGEPPRCEGIEFASVEADSCVAVGEAAHLARLILVAAGVISNEELTLQRGRTDLVVRPEDYWRLQDGRTVLGTTWGSRMEIDRKLTSLLHEELHRLHADRLQPGTKWHEHWLENGYYGLDDVFQVALQGRFGLYCENYPVTLDQRKGLALNGLPLPTPCR